MEIAILKKLNERRGNALPLACAIVICLLLLSSAIMEYIRLTIIANGVHDALQAAVISVSTGNYDETYSSLREGYSGGYNKVGGAWREKLDKGDIYAELDDLLGLDESHTKIAGDYNEYSLLGLSVNITNSPFAPSIPNAASKFTAEARVMLEVPLSFGWDMLPPLRITVRTTAGFTPKF